LSADRAQGVFDDVLKQLAVPSYVQDGIVFGPFYEGNERTAIYNAGFRPFQSPVPFLFVRHGVISDWKFFLDNGDWLNLWGRRFGESAVHALAEELRRSRGGWGATNPKVASRRKDHLIPPTGGPEGTLAGVARWVGRNRDLVPGARSSTRVMPVPNHPAASACTLKFSRVYSHRTIAGGIGHNVPQEAPEAFADAVLQAGGRGT